MKVKETRYFETQVEVREGQGDESQKIVGYPALFNSMSEDLGGFKERIKPGAFKRTLEMGADVRALMNHDSNYVLGRNKSGTLTLEEDARGLKMVVDPPDTGWARDLKTSMQRGDINQMSFGFMVESDEWEMQGGQNIRTLTEVNLFDVSVVTYPAYPETSANVRSMFQDAGLNNEKLAEVFARSKHDLPLTDEDRSLIKDSIKKLEDLAVSSQAEDSASEAQARELAIKEAQIRLLEAE